MKQDTFIGSVEFIQKSEKKVLLSSIEILSLAVIYTILYFIVDEKNVAMIGAIITLVIASFARPQKELSKELVCNVTYNVNEDLLNVETKLGVLKFNSGFVFFSHYDKNLGKLIIVSKHKKGNFFGFDNFILMVDISTTFSSTLLNKGFITE